MHHHHPFHHEVSALFRRSTSRSVRTGVEQELFTRDASDGSVVSIDRVRGATRGSSYEQWVGFEPGGQLELSSPAASSLPHLADWWRRTTADLRNDCADAGIRLDAVPVDDREVPRQLVSRRYVEMER